MAEATTTVRIQALIKGVEGVEQLKSAISRLQNTARPASSDIERLRLAASVLGKTGLQTTNDLRAQVSVLRELRNNVLLGSEAYRQLTRDLKQAEVALNKVTQAGGRGQKFAGLATVASSGLFGGPEAFVGSAIGLAVTGTPAGAAAGAIAGQTARQIREATAGAASYAASIKRLEIALRGVTKTSGEFYKAQKIIADVSQELNVPLDASTRQFTQLAASVIGAGGSVEDAELVFRGVSEAIKATGGEAHDVQSAIRAMSQIFGKGKVSAEELQGQLGERLPGAVVKFATATGRTLPQLQKDLRDGTVGLNDVMKFVVKLSDDHRAAALEMASSTEDAGQRMGVALKSLTNEFGQFFQPVGAGIQDLITLWARFTADVLNGARNLGSAWSRTDELMGVLRDNDALPFGKKRELMREADAIARENVDLYGGDFQVERQEALNTLLYARAVALGLIDEELKNVTDSTKDWGLTTEETVKTALEGLQEAASDYLEKINDMGTQVKDAVTNAFKGMEDALVDFVMTGKLKFRELALSIMKDMARIAIRQAVMAPFTSMMGNLFKTNADGNVYAQNGIQAFARGGVVNRPTIFPFAGGTGLMGEAGPEAILPLTRRNGKLGVEGGGGSNVVVNVDATGSSVEGQEKEAQELGRALSVAVQAEMIKQKLPGGLLA